jgi:hypothetical protein
MEWLNPSHSHTRFFLILQPLFQCVKQLGEPLPAGRCSACCNDGTRASLRQLQHGKVVIWGEQYISFQEITLLSSYHFWSCSYRVFTPFLRTSDRVMLNSFMQNSTFANVSSSTLTFKSCSKGFSG